MFKPKLVIFKNGKYGIRRMEIPFVYEYLSSLPNDDFWWTDKYLEKYAQFNTIGEAVVQFARIQRLNAKKNDKGTVLGELQ